VEIFRYDFSSNFMEYKVNSFHGFEKKEKRITRKVKTNG